MLFGFGMTWGNNTYKLHVEKLMIWCDVGSCCKTNLQKRSRIGEEVVLSVIPTLTTVLYYVLVSFILEGDVWEQKRETEHEKMDKKGCSK